MEGADSKCKNALFTVMKGITRSADKKGICVTVCVYTHLYSMSAIKSVTLCIDKPHSEPDCVMQGHLIPSQIGFGS